MSSTPPLPLAPCAEERFLLFKGERMSKEEEENIECLLKFFPEEFRLELPEALRRVCTDNDPWPDEDDDEADKAANDAAKQATEAHNARVPHTLEDGVVVDDVVEVVLRLTDPEQHTTDNCILMPHIMLWNIRGSL